MCKNKCIRNEDSCYSTVKLLLANIDKFGNSFFLTFIFFLINAVGFTDNIVFFSHHCT